MWGERIIPPMECRPQILTDLHKTHQGLTKSLLSARSQYYWPGIKNDVTQRVEVCETCQRHRNAQPAEKKLEIIAPLTRPMELFSADIYEWAGKTYLAMCDGHSGMLFSRPMPRITSSELIKALESIFNITGYPERLRSDNGRQFVSAETREYLHGNGIRLETSSPEFPSSNGHAEQSVKTIKKLFKKCLETKTDFQSALAELNRQPRTDGIIPADIFFRRPVRGNHPRVISDPNSVILKNNASGPPLEPSSSFEINEPVSQATASLPSSETETSNKRERNHSEKKIQFQENSNSATIRKPENLKEFRKLNPGEIVYVWNIHQKTWSAKAKVLERVTERSYNVECCVDFHAYRKNRKYLRPMNASNYANDPDSQPSQQERTDKIAPLTQSKPVAPETPQEEDPVPPQPQPRRSARLQARWDTATPRPLAAISSRTPPISSTKLATSSPKPAAFASSIYTKKDPEPRASAGPSTTSPAATWSPSSEWPSLFAAHASTSGTAARKSTGSTGTTKGTTCNKKTFKPFPISITVTGRGSGTTTGLVLRQQ